MTKSPLPTEMSNRQINNTKHCQKAIVDRLRTVSWSNYSHTTGEVNRIWGSGTCEETNPLYKAIYHTTKSELVYDINNDTINYLISVTTGGPKSPESTCSQVLPLTSVDS